MKRCFAVLRDRAGVASVEAGLFTTLLVAPLLGGATDAGLVLYSWSQITRAQQAGMLSAWGNGATASTIVSAASAAYGSSPVTPTVQAVIACYCLPSATPWNRTGAVPVACPSTCGSGTTFTQFATVSVSTSVTLPLPLPLLGFSSPYVIATKATARLQ
jgi:Flp pilus assembly protein TadG